MHKWHSQMLAPIWLMISASSSVYSCVACIVSACSGSPPQCSTFAGNTCSDDNDHTVSTVSVRRLVPKRLELKCSQCESGRTKRLPSFEEEPQTLNGHTHRHTDSKIKSRAEVVRFCSSEKSATVMSCTVVHFWLHHTAHV